MKDNFNYIQKLKKKNMYYKVMTLAWKKINANHFGEVDNLN